jgi:hypothetical protein
MKRRQAETRPERVQERKPTPAPKEPAARKPVSGNSETRLTPEELERMIAAAAYQRAEKRGFAPGHEIEDWLEAEKEVKHRIQPGAR